MSDAIEQLHRAVQTNLLLPRHTLICQPAAKPRRIDEALEYYRQAIRLNPKITKAHYIWVLF
jgi:hypothetical protein